MKNNLTGKKSAWNHPNKGVFWVFKTESILPLHAPSKKRGYDGQTKPPDSLRLLLVEVLHWGKFLDDRGEVTKLDVSARSNSHFHTRVGAEFG